MSSLPKTPIKGDPETRRFLEAVRQNLTSVSKDAITVSDLRDAGFWRGNNIIIPPSSIDGSTVVETPTIPTGLTTLGVFQNIILEWQVPPYRGHAWTSIYRSATNVFADAVVIANVNSETYADPVGPGQTYYYWATNINLNGVESAPNQVAGTIGQTLQDTQYLLDLLTNSIGNTQLNTQLGTRISTIESTQTSIIQQIDDLEAAFGNSQSSADNLAAAQAAASQAIAAKVEAIGAKDEAVQAKVDAIEAADDAVVAKNAAETASTSASTSAGSASSSATNASNSAASAATSANSASTAATAANAARTAAESANTAAQTASTAAINASNSASTFATNAQTAATAASNSATTANSAKNDAQTAADAASTSASTATTAATNAASAATAATTAKTAAEAANAAAQTSATAAANSATTASGYADDAEAAATVSSNASLSASAARDGAVTARDAAQVSATAAATSATTATAKATEAADSAFASNAAKVAAESARDSAGSSASAAALSASNAATYADDSQSSAASSAGSAVTATAAKTDAQSAAGNAATSASNAAGSATSAANSASNAATSASAAATSASNAAASATAAGQSATSSSNSANLAQTSAATALTYRDQSAASATTAQGYASAAAQDYSVVNARLNNFNGSGVSVEQNSVATANTINGLSGQYTIKIDNNGYVSGFGLASTSNSSTPVSTFIVRSDRFAISSPSGPGVTPKTPFIVVTTPTVENGVTIQPGVYIDNAVIKDASISSAKIGALVADKITTGTLKVAIGLDGDLNVGTGRIIFDTGSYMKVQGIAFGSSNQFIEWFGPKLASFSQCTEANAITYIKRDGSAYFGGSLSAGTLKNAARTTGIGSFEVIELGPFGSNGGTRTVVLSYNYLYAWQITNALSYSGTPSAQIVLERANGAGGWTTLSTLNVTGSVEGFDGYGQFEPGYIRIEMGGSTTFTDTSGSLNVTYRGRMVSRTIPSVFSNGTGFPTITQSVGVISTEQ